MHIMQKHGGIGRIFKNIRSRMKHLRKLKRYSAFVNNVTGEHRNIEVYESFNNINYPVEYIPEYDLMHTPFTIRLHGTGKVILKLMPGLYITGGQFSIWHKLSNTYTSQSFTYNYDSNDENARRYETPILNPGDEIIIAFNWDGTTNRSLGYPARFTTRELVYGYDDGIGSNIYCTCDYSVFGNLGSLITGDYITDN